MEWFKDMIVDNFKIVIIVLVGIAAIAIYTLFFQEGGLFEGFTKDIIELGMQMIKDQFGVSQ